MQTAPSVRGRLRPSRYAVCALAAAAALLSSCGSESNDSTSTSSSSPTATSPSATPSPSGSPSASMPESGRARPTTMTGTVTGIKDGCTVFKDDRSGHQWVLIGEAKGLASGTAYTVSGVAMDAMDPNCSQGLPFHVTEATPVAQDDGIELTGTLEAGVEAGCRILRSETGTYVLSGTVEPADGTKVTVRGTKSDNVVSHCQQGEVIEVQSVTEVK